MAADMSQATDIQQASGLIVPDLFRYHALYHGQRIAIEDATRLLTYTELNSRVNRLVHALVDAGVGRGDRIAILSENRAEYVELELAAAKLGAIAACQNWRQSRTELEHCLNLATPKLALVSERHAPALAALSHEMPRIVHFGEEYESLLGRSVDSEPPHVASPEDGLVILYTSGTTGLPKGAVISQRAMIARTQIEAVDRPTMPTDTYVAWAPFFHMVSTDRALSTLMRGGKVLVHDGFDAERLAQAVASEQLGWLNLMPGMIEPTLEALRAAQVRPIGVRSLGCMADLVPRHQIAELTSLLQAPYVNTFGSTETGSAPASKGLIPIGVTPDNLAKEQSSFCSIRLVDDDDCEVPDGEPGELTIRGPSLFSGYWHAPEVNAECFRRGWFHMGDVFSRNPDGLLNFVDRKKYLIKSGGENIYPAEIEQVLLSDDRVADVAVVRKADARWGEVPVAFVVKRDPRLTPEDIVGLCRGRVANYKLPKEVRFLSEDDLPRSTTGKIQRHELERRLIDDDAERSR